MRFELSSHPTRVTRILERVVRLTRTVLNHTRLYPTWHLVLTDVAKMFFARSRSLNLQYSAASIHWDLNRPSWVPDLSTAVADDVSVLTRKRGLHNGTRKPLASYEISEDDK